MIQPVLESAALEMYEDYVLECKQSGDEPLSWLEWLDDQQIEPV
jgi:hypothetical protein